MLLSYCNDLSMSLFANNTCTAVNSLLFTYGKRIIVHYNTVHLDTIRPQYLIHLSNELKQWNSHGIKNVYILRTGLMGCHAVLIDIWLITWKKKYCEDDKQWHIFSVFSKRTMGPKLSSKTKLLCTQYFFWKRTFPMLKILPWFGGRLVN